MPREQNQLDSKEEWPEERALSLAVVSAVTEVVSVVAAVVSVETEVASVADGEALVEIEEVSVEAVVVVALEGNETNIKKRDRSIIRVDIVCLY